MQAADGFRMDMRTGLRYVMRMAIRTASIDRSSEPGHGSEPSRIPVNLSLPEDLVRTLDQIAGPRRRSAFAEEAIRRAIKREQFRIAGERYAGALKAEDYPHWRTSEDVVEWVRMMRAEETSTDVDLG